MGPADGGRKAAAFAQTGRRCRLQGRAGCSPRISRLGGAGRSPKWQEANHKKPHHGHTVGEGLLWRTKGPFLSGLAKLGSFRRRGAHVQPPCASPLPSTRWTRAPCADRPSRRAASLRRQGASAGGCARAPDPMRALGRGRACAAVCSSAPRPPSSSDQWTLPAFPANPTLHTHRLPTRPPPWPHLDQDSRRTCDIRE